MFVFYLMASYDPPTENLPIFDNSVFIHTDIIDDAYLRTHYLRYPTAQGTENFGDIVVNGTGQFDDDVNVIGLTSLYDTLTLEDDSAPATNHATINASSSTNLNQVVLCLNPTGGGFNFLTRTGDSILYFNKNQTPPYGLTIAPWSAVNCGIRLTDSTAMISAGGTGIDGTTNMVFNGSTIAITSPSTTMSGNLSLTNTSAPSRQITASYFNVNDISANLTGTQIYQNTATCFFDNNYTLSGSFTFAVNDGAGAQTIPLTISSTSISSSKSILLTTNGTYIRFPDGSQQTTAYPGPTASSTYTTIFTSSTSIPLASGCKGISVRLVGPGGNAGSPADQNGGNWCAGGTGGGGSTVWSQGIIPLIGGNTLTLTVGSTVELLIGGTSIARADKGGNGGNATNTTGGTAGIGATTWSANTNYGDWSTKPGGNGVVGGTALNYQTPSYPSTAGTPLGVPYSDTNYGCGQRWNGPGLSINAYQGPPITLASGACYITYYF